MKRNEVLHILKKQQKQMDHYGVKTLAFFGSHARDEATAESDVDILVEFKGHATLDTYMGLKFFLEDTLKTPIDLVTKKAIKPRLQPIIEKEAVYVRP